MTALLRAALPQMLDRVAKPPAEGKCSGAVTIKGPVDSVYYGAPSSVTLNVRSQLARALSPSIRAYCNDAEPLVEPPPPSMPPLRRWARGPR